MIFLGIAVVMGAAAASEALLRANEYDQAAYQGRGRNRRTVLPCQRVGTLEVEVLEGPHGNTVDLADALVDVVELGTYAYSLGNGRLVIFWLTPGTYTIRARKEWYAPDAGATQAAVQVDNGRTTRITLRLESMHFHLHVDADRDGAVDDSRTGISSWAWGDGNKGTVILCNNDDDGAPHAGAPDNAANDTDINTAADLTDIAPLDLRREGRGTAALPHGWSMRLAVSGANQNNIRVFDLRTGAGTEVIGPNTVADYQIPNVAVNGHARLEMGMEALRYAGTGFTGAIELTMTMSKPATGYSAHFRTNTTYSEKAKVRVAPWMVFHHRDTAAMVYVADRGGQNAAFRNDLQAMANTAGLP
ncbi:MAG: carboxypeptidase-like regulatory domain-containing protein, partial [Candidatus Kapaibacterium sp.]